MKIENGKYYRTADGRKVGPIRGGPATYHAQGADHWYDDGTSLYKDLQNIVAEWRDEPTVWGDMTPEQKGALLLAEHEGKTIDTWIEGGWTKCLDPMWRDDCAYRIKPDPVVETRGVYVAATPPIKIGTINLIDGTPDPATLNLEPTND